MPIPRRSDFDPLRAPVPPVARGTAGTSRRTPVVVGVVLAVLSAVLATVAKSDGADAGAAEAERLAAAALQAQITLAGEKRPYLVLSVAERTLTLYFGASPLRVWPVERVEVGARRLRLPRPSLDRGWRSLRWEGPILDPPVVRERRVIVSDSVDAPDLTGADPWIPPTPEEQLPTPSRFVVHYRGGLGVEVVAVGEESTRPRSIVGAARRALVPGRGSDRYRVRLTMVAGEAGALYRSFPEDAPLVLKDVSH